MSNHAKTAFIFGTLLLLLTILSLFRAVGSWSYVLVGIIWFVVVVWKSLSISSNYHVKAYCANQFTKQNSIAITFDDGPTPKTLSILNLLQEYNVKASFFCIGKNMERYPEIVHRIIEEGHLIANHTYSHSPIIDFYNKQQWLKELTTTDAIIEKLSGKKPQFFRPPYGVTTPSMRRALETTKHKVIGWNIRSLDGVIKNEKIILTKILSSISPGGIVLLHDTSLHTVKIVEQLLKALREKNYNVVSLEQLLDLQAYAN